MKIDLRSSVPVGIREQDPLKQGLKQKTPAACYNNFLLFASKIH